MTYACDLNAPASSSGLNDVTPVIVNGHPGSKAQHSPRCGTWPMGDQAQGEQAQGGEARTQSKRKRPLEEYNKTLLGLIALVVVAVIVATMLLFKAIAPGTASTRPNSLRRRR